jgi:hypothetical protein
MMKKREHNHLDDTTELLSAYVDNAVDVTERRRAEALIKSCEACAQELQELRLLRQWLRSLPEVQPRRSFKLHPVTKPPRRLIFPTLRWATLAAATLLFVVLGIDTLSRVSPQREAAVSMQQQAEPAAAPEALSRRLEDDTGVEADEPAAAAVPESESSPAVPEPKATPAAEEPSMAEAAPAAKPGPTEEPMTAAGTSTEEAPALSASPTDDREMASETAPSFDTLGQEAEADAIPSDVPVDTLRIAVVILLLVTIALGSGAVWTQRRHI